MVIEDLTAKIVLVTDGMMNCALLRCFVDALVRGAGKSEFPAQALLEERLATVVPSAELEPSHVRALNTARQRRWSAVGFVIFQLRMVKIQVALLHGWFDGIVG